MEGRWEVWFGFDFFEDDKCDEEDEEDEEETVAEVFFLGGMSGELGLCPSTGPSLKLGFGFLAALEGKGECRSCDL